MNRISYQYQLLRFMPDRITGEFAHVGVVMYLPEQRFLKAFTLKKYGRLSQFFGEIPGHYLMHTLQQIQKSIEIRSERFQQELTFSPIANLDQITREIFQPDDSALFFSEMRTGVALSADKAFDLLINKFLHKEADEIHRFTDKEIWTKIYRKYFEEKGIAGKLHEKTIQTPTDTIRFDLAYKNGHVNCLEPINFELKQEDAIRDKVNKIIGKWDALSDSPEALEYHILANIGSQSNEMESYIRKRLSNRQHGNAAINLVTEKDLKAFIYKVEMDLNEAE